MLTTPALFTNARRCFLNALIIAEELLENDRDRGLSGAFLGNFPGNYRAFGNSPPTFTIF